MAVSVVYNKCIITVIKNLFLSLHVVLPRWSYSSRKELTTHVILNWKSISAVYAKRNSSSNQLNTPLSDISDIFSNKLGTIMTESVSSEMQPLRAKLNFHPKATPKSYKPRFLTFAIKDAIDLELDSLESKGIITKVSHSNWASPIVTVSKSIADSVYVGITR